MTEEKVLSEIKNQNYRLEIFASLFSVVAAIGTSLSKIAESRLAIAVGLIASFFFFRGLLKFGRSRNRKSSVSTNNNSKTNKLFRYLGVINFILPIISLILIASILLPKNTSNCLPKSEIGVLVTNFSLDSDDNFSLKLFNLVEAELGSADSIILERFDRHINIGKSGYLDSLRSVFEGSCFNRGLVIFGKRSLESELFECKVFIQNLNKKANTFHSGKTIVYLQHPDMVDFSIENQAKVVSDLIIGLLHYNSGNYSEATQKFQLSLSSTSEKRQSLYKSFCHLFIGNSLCNQGKFDEAIVAYKLALENNRQNSQILYNLGIAFLNINQIDEAYQYFSQAQQLDYQLENPIEINGSKKILSDSSRLKLPAKNNQAVLKRSKEDSIGMSTEFIRVTNGKKFGIAGLDKKILVGYEYDYISELVYKLNNSRVFVVRLGDKFGAIDVNNQVLIDFIYKSEAEVESEVPGLLKQ